MCQIYITEGSFIQFLCVCTLTMTSHNSMLWDFALMVSHQYSKSFEFWSTSDFVLGVLILCEECRPNVHLRSLVGTVYLSSISLHENCIDFEGHLGIWILFWNFLLFECWLFFFFWQWHGFNSLCWRITRGRYIGQSCEESGWKNIFKGLTWAWWYLHVVLALRRQRLRHWENHLDLKTTNEWKSRKWKWPDR